MKSPRACQTNSAATALSQDLRVDEADADSGSRIHVFLIIRELLTDDLLLCVVHSEACVRNRGLQLLRLLVVVLNDSYLPSKLVKLRGVVNDVEKAFFINLSVVGETMRQ